MTKTVALDLDGVVYTGGRLLPGAAEAVIAIRSSNLHVWFVTNNSAQTRSAIAAKLSRLGVPAAESDVMTSGYATSLYVRRLAHEARVRVVVVGSDELKAMLAAAGLVPVAEPPGDFLVVGMDRAFTYLGIKTALDALLDGAVFVACNRDATYPVEGGERMPGCGPIVAAIECAADHQADYVVGKPGPLLLEMVAAADGILPSELLVVGDTPESDVAAARNFGSQSVLIRGPAQTPSASSGEGRSRPDYVLQTLADLPGLLTSKLGMGSS